MSRNILACVLLTFVLLIPAQSFAASSNIAVVDLRRAFAETKAGKKVLTKLKTEFDRRQKELDQAQQDLLKWKEDITKKIELMTDAEKRRKQEEFAKRVQTLQQQAQRLQAEMTSREEKLSGPILKKLQQQLERIADEEKLDVVLQIGPHVAWAKKSLDITDQLIRRFDRAK